MSFTKLSLCLTIAAMLSPATFNVSRGETIRLPVTKDNSIVLVDGEWDHNAGRQGRMRIKGNQHLVAMGFDTSALTGRTIQSATLICVAAEHIIQGVSISTIATPWDEYLSSGLTAGVENIPDWGYPGARFPAVCGGNSHTLVHSMLSDVRDGVYYWNVPPDMIYAMTLGVAHGLAIHEHDADYGRNPTIYSREQSGKQPYLVVELADQPAGPAPLPPTDLQLTASASQGAMLVLSPPRHGFAYDVLVDGRPLPRHNIPLWHPGQRQVIWLRDLDVPSSEMHDPLQNKTVRQETHDVQVIARNRSDQRAVPATIRVPATVFDHSPDLSELRPVAESGAESPRPKKGTPAPAATARTPATALSGISVIPVTDQYDRTGQRVGNLPPDYRTRNSLFDGQQIMLSAAAGEVVSFQLLLRGDQKVDVKASLESLPARIDLWQAVYVPEHGRSIPDPVLPLSAGLPLSMETDQSVIVDVLIPFDAPAGSWKGEVTISDGRRVPLTVQVHAFAIPRQATFFCEMNGYGLPDHVADYYALQQVACDHRVHVNILHYSHHTAAPGARKSNMDMRLPSGRRMDNVRYNDFQPNASAGFWDDFVSAFGPCLDGSLFKESHRGPIPLPGFYLTFHESWPLNCRAFFNGNPDAYLAFADHPEYAATYIRVLQDFQRLAAAQGWDEAGFQVYFNNKGSLDDQQKAPWILDEPVSFWDYRALKYYGELTDRGRSAVPAIRTNYRIDISRPEFTRGQLDGRSDLWIVSTWAWQHYRRLVTDRIQQDGLQAWVYGTANAVGDSNRNIQGWALDAWQDGATGVVPWQTIDKSGRALTQADQLGLLIFDADANGQTVIRHSLRLKAFRDAQQLIEYLNLLQQRRGWSPQQMRQFVSSCVSLDAQVRKSDEADAGTTDYSRVTAAELENLRAAAARLLNESPASAQ